MDSVAHVQAALNAFLESPDPGVIAVKGDWGTGKTFLWRQLIGKQKSAAMCTRYSYASLFGCSTVAEIRQALFESQVSMGSLASDASVFLRKKSASLARYAGPPGIQNTELLANVFVDKALREIVVCLDDLERKEQDLSPAALLGFITNLRDERRCKVVLLFNESKTDQDKPFADALAEFREKVIDHEVRLNPSVEQCYQIIFGDGKFDKLAAARSTPSAEQGDDRTLLQIFQAAEIANIRLLRKTRTVLEYLELHVGKRYRNQWPVVARQAVKLCCLHFTHAHHFRVEEVAAQKQWIRMFLNRNKNGKGSARDKTILAEVDKIGYTPDQTDQITIDFIRHGFVDWDSYTALFDELEAESASAKVQAEYAGSWNLLRENFRADLGVIVSAIRAVLQKHHRALAVQQVAGAVKFLREYDPNPTDERMLAEKIEDYAKFCTKNPRKLELMDLEPEISKKILSLLEKQREDKAIGDVLTMLTRPGGWNSEDILHLRKTTQAQFFAWLKEETRPGLLRALHELRIRLAGDPVGKVVLKKLDAALHQLAKRSPIDRRRVYGILKLPPKAKRAAAPSNQPPAVS